MDNCKNCGFGFGQASRFCPTCGQDVGFPNVRLAENLDEKAEFDERLKTAYASGDAGGYRKVLDELGVAVRSSSQAIIGRPLSMLQDLIDNDRNLYTSHLQKLASEAKLAGDRTMEKVRPQFENAVAPNFAQHIRFAALTLNQRWLRAYGCYAMILRDTTIASRATVFEENPDVFVERHKILLNRPFPPGYRATWPLRGELAKAKLYSKLSKSTDPSEFGDLLLNEAEGDYIEVHIYGPFNRNAIECVLGVVPRTREDKLGWKLLVQTVKAAGGAVKEVA